MIKENQLIEITIMRNSMKDYYESKGYKIIKLGQTITINAVDISPSSHRKIIYICDYCGKEFERVPHSNKRSCKYVQKDACAKCAKSKKFEETCLQKYRVKNPMQLDSVQIKQQESRAAKPNFGEQKTFNSCSYFVNGIPVSAAQDNLHHLFPDFVLNYHFHQYYIDLWHNGACIEYDGRGHDMGVRMGRISKEDFIKKEESKKNIILQENRLLRIIDKKDKFSNINNITVDYLNKIKQFIESDELYKEINVD